MKQIPRPSRSTAIAITALFVALGSGGAVAATTIPAGSVGHRQLRTGAVWKNNLSRGLKADLARIHSIVVRSLGPVGPQGPVGPPGPAGTAGGSPVQPLHFASQKGTGATTIFDSDGLTLTAACDGSGQVSVVATPAASGVLSWALTGFQRIIPQFNAATTILSAGTSANGRAGVLFQYVSASQKMVTGTFAATDAQDSANTPGFDCVLFGSATAF